MPAEKIELAKDAEEFSGLAAEGVEECLENMLEMFKQVHDLEFLAKLQLQLEELDMEIRGIKIRN